MIVGDLKPLDEIVSSVAGYRRILVLGCGSCVTVSLSGGDREAAALVRELNCMVGTDGAPVSFEVGTILRQCEKDLVTSFYEVPPDTDAILSLACGAGVQTVGDAFEPLPVIPALNTTFIGASDEAGVWREMCHGCGDCLLGVTGGICPVARCAKSLFNGPCGGSQGGCCEIYIERPCAWAMIYFRLKKQNKLHLLHEVRMPRDWRTATASGPRERRRTGIGGSAGETNKSAQ
ncbi:methylenetetrahydrofolate reductase C-terminal domain-containing protein [Desulfococcaceae bacterium HSG7]|nr:methylenetetrahydrofolate reductase C-terminal domain-containing protein [Desulfococcaceae bacterium HSG7]